MRRGVREIGRGTGEDDAGDQVRAESSRSVVARRAARVAVVHGELSRGVRTGRGTGAAALARRAFEIE